MLTDHADSPYGPVVQVRPEAGARAVVVCEHASNRLAETLGLAPDLLDCHIAWDPGALAVAERLAARLGATLVAGTVSRLVYDCNRPPEAPDAIPALSEVHAVPGNRNLSRAAKAARAAAIHDPFHQAVATALDRAARPLLVTVHSFTPVYKGTTREVELGLLHGDDARLAQAMLRLEPDALPFVTRLNQPYGQGDGVTYMIDRHGATQGRLNVMLELRNDLIATAETQDAAAALLAPWIEAATEAAS